MFSRPIICFIILSLSLFLPTASVGQKPNPVPPGSTPTKKSGAEDQQEPVRILIEEVQIPVAAYDEYGHLDPTLELDDLLILENGIRQVGRSVRRIPASVVLLLDTGGEINSAKNIRVTRAIARNLVSTLAQKDQVSIMQFNNKVDLLQDWTTDRDRLNRVLDTQLLSGKRASFSPAIAAAVDQFRDQPVGSRHLVMITDGVESPGTRPGRQAAISRLMASNAVLHVISYTQASRDATKESLRIMRNRDKSITPDDAVNSLPPDDHGPVPGGYFQLRQLHKPGGKTFDLDPLRRRQIKEYEEAMREAEFLLTSLSTETGGKIWLGETLEQMIADGAATARLIDSEFLVTYKPGRPLATARKGEERRVEVASRRVGLNIVARRSYVVGGEQ